MIGIYKKIQRHFNFFSQIWCCLQVILERRMLNSSKVLPVLNLLKQLFWETMMPGILNSFLERGRMEFNFSLSGESVIYSGNAFDYIFDLKPMNLAMRIF
ncbi:hypothetical protein SO802_000636 [Lithocarpus litseifolius]|uniref:Uncharacterized protein n=1 Tax=Lithocarpus litseifolius TaxID=425828 RepID=A0AAW2DS42_9ROSI